MPEPRNLVSNFAAVYGTICDSQRVLICAGLPGKVNACMLLITLLRLDARRLMAVISAISQVVKRERQLKQSEAWFNAVLTGTTDYALMSVDTSGRREP